MLLPPLNDKDCLGLLHEEVQRYGALPSVQAFAAQFQSTEDLARFIRQLEQRNDIGDPNDGPRLPCDVSQRARFASDEPNCFERTLVYHSLAEIIDPDTERTSASLIVDDGWHTFPIEMRNGLPSVVVLDPHAPPRNAMASTAYEARNAIPNRRDTIARWFLDAARNACLDDDDEQVLQRALDVLRCALLTGEPIEDVEELEHVLGLVARDAPLFGARGEAAYHRVYTSIRNLSLKLNRGTASRFVRKLASTGKEVAPHAIKAALIAQYGPAAAIALEGTNLAVSDPDDVTDEERTLVETQEATQPTKTKSQTPSPDSRERLRRMSMAFR